LTGREKVFIRVAMTLTKREKQLFYQKKLTPIIRKLLVNLHQTKYTWSEMCEISGIPQSRMSEFVNNKNGRRYVNEKFLLLLIKGKVIDMTKALENTKLTEDESEHVESLNTMLLNDEGLRNEIARSLRLKKDPKQILKESNDRAEG